MWAGDGPPKQGSGLKLNEHLSAHPIRTHPEGEFLQFFVPSPHEAAVLPSDIVATNMCFLHSDEFLSPKVLDLDGCFSRETPTMGDSLVWTGSSMSGPSGGCLKTSEAGRPSCRDPVRQDHDEISILGSFVPSLCAL